jgi:hypothetical protein
MCFQLGYSNRLDGRLRDSGLAPAGRAAPLNERFRTGGMRMSEPERRICPEPGSNAFCLIPPCKTEKKVLMESPWRDMIKEICYKTLS